LLDTAIVGLLRLIPLLSIQGWFHSELPSLGVGVFLGI